MEGLGPSTRGHRDWFDENHAEIMDLIGKKHVAQLAHLHDPLCTTKKDALRSIRSTVQLKLHEMQDSWLNARAEEIQVYSDKNDMKNLQQFEGGLRSHQCRLISASECRWNKTPVREEQDPGVLNRLSINEKVIAASSNERITQCHSNSGGSSDSYPATIQRYSTRIWFNSCGILYGGWISIDG